MCAAGHEQESNSLDGIRARIWEQTKDQTLARMAFLEKTFADLSQGPFTEERRAQAASESHKLAGSLGTFGFLEASRLAQAMEQMLKQNGELKHGDGKALGQFLLQLRRELDPAIERLKANPSAR
jgi:HPt (histidine-containing phosphotransfer) domain-containing protein